MPKGSVSTDAAYVQADSSSVAPKVRGLVSQVLVGHNQTVRKGDAAAAHRPEEFDARVASAEADIANAEAAAASARAALIALDAEQRLAGSTVRAAQTGHRRRRRENVRAQADRKRYEDLADSGAVAGATSSASAPPPSALSRTPTAVALSSRSARTRRRHRRQARHAAAALAQAEAAVARARAALILAARTRATP
jgi:membrane fusion protein (multidrug efflux system)